MDFSYSNEQTLLADSLQRWLRERYPFDLRRKIAASETGFSRDHWREMAELGWLGAALPEAYGGLGGGPVETMLIAQAFGRGLVLEPYLSTAVLGASLLLAAGSEAQKRELLPKIAAGELIVAFAHAEPQARFDLHDVTLRADGGALTGRKIAVMDAAAADLIIVRARGGLFLVEAGARGLTRRDWRSVDGRRGADLTFERTPAVALGDPEGVGEMVEAVADRAIAALVAEAVGCMQALHEATLAYIGTRRQFGRAIGEFQVIQHRMVAMFGALEQAKSMAILAALKADAPARERARAASAAKAFVGRAAKLVGAEAIQLHGGMGMTDELAVGHYYKRLLAIETLFGNTDWHTRRVASLPA